MLHSVLGLFIINPKNYSFLNAKSVRLQGSNSPSLFVEYATGLHSFISSIEVSTTTIKCTYLNECAFRVPIRIAFVSLHSVWIFVFLICEIFCKYGVCRVTAFSWWILVFEHSLKFHSLTFVTSSHHTLFSIAYISGFCAFCDLWFQGLS